MEEKLATVNIGKELAKKVRIEAAKRDMKMKELIVELIEKGFAAEKEEKEKGTH